MDNVVTCTMWLEICTSTYRGPAILISFNYHLPYFKLPSCPSLGPSILSLQFAEITKAVTTCLCYSTSRFKLTCTRKNLPWK